MKTLYHSERYNSTYIIKAPYILTAKAGGFTAPLGKYVGLLQHINNNYEDIEDNILSDLEARDEEFCALLHESSDMEHRYKFIGRVFHGNEAVSLTAEEHGILLEYLDVDRQIDAKERRAIYFAGHRDAHAYEVMLKR